MNRKFKIFKNECNIEYNEMDYDRAVAISIAGEIISTENFELDIDKNGEFKLVDYQEANLGGIENDRFTNLANVIDRLSIYHQDTYYKPFEERRDIDIISGKKSPNLSNGKEIEKGDWDSAILYLMSSDKFTSMLQNITPSNYDYYDKIARETIFTEENKIPMNYKTPVHYLADKLIAESIFETQSAYTMVEYENKVYLSYYGFGDGKYYEPIIEDGVIIDDDLSKPVSPKTALLSYIKCSIQIYDENGKNEIFTTYDNYDELIESQKEQILNDIEDIGIEDHYLNEYAFCYLGMEKEYDNAIDELIESRKEQNLDMPDVSDIIVIECNGESKAYYCDSIGFKEIPTFIEQIKSEKINKNEDKTEDFDIDL